MDKATKTIESYNHCANTFVHTYMDLGLFEQFFREFSDLLKEGSTILDLGCGPGNVSKFLADQNKGYKIVGVDLSTEMLQYAKQYVPSGQFILADLRHLVLKQTFDAVIASFCIIHLNDNETTDLLRKTFDLLGDVGYLYISFMHGGVPGFEKASFSENEMFFYYHVPEEIMKVLEKVGYRVISKYRHDYQRTPNQAIQDIIIIARK
jgi:cyclopropane fatty-acyl-phospholipid synthase-like methyltransferase